MSAPAELAPLKPLIEAVVAGDTEAWLNFQTCLFPTLERWAARHRGMRAGGLHRSRDDVRDVAVRVLERIRRDNFAMLRAFRARAAAEDVLESWIYTELEYAVREHRRQRHGRNRARTEPQDGTPASKRLLNTLAERLETERAGGAYALSTGLLAARQIVSHILRTFSESEQLLIRAVLLAEGERGEKKGSASVIALRVRRLKARLRARFAKP